MSRSKIIFDKIKKSLQKTKQLNLNRTHIVQNKYNEYKKIVEKTWISLGDYLIYKLFGIKYTKNNYGMKYVRTKDIAHNDNKNNKNIVAIRNKFPYNFPVKVVHYILWKLHGPIKTNEISLFAKKKMQKYNGIDYITWENPYYKKSVKNINHMHIVILL